MVKHQRESRITPFSPVTVYIGKLELDWALYACVTAEVTSAYHLQYGSQRAMTAGMMVAAKCQQTQLWKRFAKTAAPCDDTDSVLNAQWHGKCLLVVSRLHQLTPLIAAHPWLCAFTSCCASPVQKETLAKWKHHSGKATTYGWEQESVLVDEHACIRVQSTHRDYRLI